MMSLRPRSVLLSVYPSFWAFWGCASLRDRKSSGYSYRSFLLPFLFPVSQLSVFRMRAGRCLESLCSFFLSLLTRLRSLQTKDLWTRIYQLTETLSSLSPPMTPPMSLCQNDMSESTWIRCVEDFLQVPDCMAHSCGFLMSSLCQVPWPHCLL